MTTIKLTKAMRQEICDKIMADVPKVDYRQQVKDLVQQDMHNALPKHIQAFCLEHPELLQNVRLHSLGTRVWVDVRGYGFNAEVPPATRAAAMGLLELDKEQEQTREALTSKVMQTLLAYTTVAKLRNDCPQFDKYLPNEAAINHPLVVVGSPIPDLILAGWPKGKTP